MDKEQIEKRLLALEVGLDTINQQGTLTDEDWQKFQEIVRELVDITLNVLKRVQ